MDSEGAMSLINSIMKTIIYHMSEFEINNSEVVGILEFCKTKIIVSAIDMEAELEDEEDEEE